MLVTSATWKLEVRGYYGLRLAPDKSLGPYLKMKLKQKELGLRIKW
jgi:hypothetical protein